MPAVPLPQRLVRLLAALALPLALLAALVPAAHRPAAAQDAARNASEFQVYSCPTDYAGTDYLTDCSPAGAGDFSITVTDTEAANPTATTPTDADGFILFGTVPGPASFALEVPGDFASFYYSCFDGAGVFQFDGSSNGFDTELSAGDQLSCRWYVIPEDASGASPSASPSAPPVGTATVDAQVFTCPVEYAGTEYLTDCTPTEDPIGVLLSPSLPFDYDDATSTETGPEGRAAFTALVAGDYGLAVDVPGEFANFYVACFDVTSGSEVFLLDGDTNTAGFALADGAGISCRFYVIPENLSGGSASPSAPASVAPSVAPSVASSNTPRPSSTGPINVLPSTGTGSEGGSAFGGFALTVLAVLAVAGVALAARRLSLGER